MAKAAGGNGQVKAKRAAAKGTGSKLAPHWYPGRSGQKPLVECCEETIEAVCRLTAEGKTMPMAAVIIGATRQQLYHWMQDGKLGIAPFDEFYRRMLEAREQFEAHCMSPFLKAIEAGDVKASMWVLGWYNRKRYGPGIIHGGDPNNPVLVAPTVIKVPHYGTEAPEQNGLPADCGE